MMRKTFKLLTSSLLLMGAVHAKVVDISTMELVYDYQPHIEVFCNALDSLDSKGTSLVVSIKKLSDDEITLSVRPENLNGALCGSNSQVRVETVTVEECVSRDATGECKTYQTCKQDVAKCYDGENHRYYSASSEKYECIPLPEADVNEVLCPTE